MSTPPVKKPGRNDPCWCGSGKKYKQCHLKQDQEEERAAIRAVPPPPTAPRPVFSPPPVPELSPEEVEAAAVFERFEEADLKGKVAIFVERVDQQRLTGEGAFEMLQSIREESNAAEDPQACDQFRRLVQRLQVSQPEVYEEEAASLLESLIQDAVADQDWARIPEWLKGLAANVETNAGEFIGVVQMLVYHDQRQALSAVLRETWPLIFASNALTSWAVEVLGVTLLNLNLFSYLETTAQPDAHDPALTGGFPPGVSVVGEVLSPVLARFSAPEPGPWQPADFDDALDAEIWETNVGLLLWDFVADRRRAAGVPYTRSNLARDLLLETLHEQIGRPAPPKSKKRAAVAPRPLSLIPDRKLLDAKLGAQFDPIGVSEPYTVVALIELLPAYLHFLVLARPHSPHRDGRRAD